MVGGVEVIHGTSSVDDVLHWPGVVTGRFGGRLWHQAEVLARKAHPVAFVGHSLGATYAASLSHKYHRPYLGYGRPGLGAGLRGDVANLGDPVSALLQVQKRMVVGHSLASYHGA